VKLILHHNMKSWESFCKKDKKQLHQKVNLVLYKAG